MAVIGNFTTTKRRSTGQRDRPVTIEQTPVADSTETSGYPAEQWTTLVAVEWMSKIDMTSMENFKAAQVTAPLTTIFEMAYRPDMDPERLDIPKTRRLVYEGRVYDITGASQIGRRDGIQIFTVVGG